MFRRILLVIFLVSALIVPGVTSACAGPKLPPPDGPVSDFAELIGPAREKKLTRRLERYRYISGHDLIVVTLDTAVGRDYADRLFSFWVERRPALKQGLILLIGGDGDVFVMTGPELRSKLGRDDATRLALPIDLGSQESQVVESAVVKRVDDVIESLVEKPVRSRSSVLFIQVVAVFFFGSMLVLPWISAMLTRATATYGGFYAALLMAFIMTLFAGPAMGALVLIAAAPIGYLMDRFITGHYSRKRSENADPSWWAGGTRF